MSVDTDILFAVRRGMAAKPAKHFVRAIDSWRHHSQNVAQQCQFCSLWPKNSEVRLDICDDYPPYYRFKALQEHLELFHRGLHSTQYFYACIYRFERNERGATIDSGSDPGMPTSNEGGKYIGDEEDVGGDDHVKSDFNRRLI
jgi:hypothetical protein